MALLRIPEVIFRTLDNICDLHGGGAYAFRDKTLHAPPCRYNTQVKFFNEYY